MSTGSRRSFVTLANALTSLSLVAGVVALISVVEGNHLQATGLVVLAVVCDSLDGPLARRTGETSAFGSNLDGLADLLAFGIVPAMALHVGPFSSLAGLGVALSIVFVLTGAWRLARFPLVKRSDVFVGLPLPAAGVPLMFFLLLSPGPALTVLVVLAVSVLMISTVPFPTLSTVFRPLDRVRRGERRRLGL